MSIDVHDPASVKSFLKTCSMQPGIYQMYSDNSEILYIGKAKNLAKRLASYFNKKKQSPKVASLVEQIHEITTIVTNTESEALILECNLIKQHKPKYNILLRDDKSYPYICLSKHDFPRLFLYRGRKQPDAISFGPYPNVYSAKQTIRLLQQVFMLRTCTDNYYNNRTRPCLLYQIKRCTGPCVELINRDEYSLNLENAKLFLEGKSSELISKFAIEMEKSSEKLDFEQAAFYRDQIQKLQNIHEQQYVEAGADNQKSLNKNIDVIAWLSSGDKSVLVILKFRLGKLVGSHEFINTEDRIFEAYDYSDKTLTENKELFDDALISILSQYYLNYSDLAPDEIIFNCGLSDNSLQLLKNIINTDSLIINTSPRAYKNKWLKLALKNAEEILDRRLNKSSRYIEQFKELKTILQLTDPINKIECVDVSHTFGKQTIASCVVFDQSGPRKEYYRRYNVDHTKGDDIAAMKQVLSRRFTKLKQKIEQGELTDILPDILLIDGGRGQVNAAKQVFMDLNLQNVIIYGITKGEGRRAINDRIIAADSLMDVPIPSKSPAMMLLQSLRDEAHRFAIVGHRKKRDKEQGRSVLDDIPGVGPKRRKNILMHLGGWQQLKSATVEQLAAIPGVSRNLAQKIHDFINR